MAEVPGGYQQSLGRGVPSSGTAGKTGGTNDMWVPFTVNGTGTLIVEIATVPSSKNWRIKRFSVESTSVPPTVFECFLNVASGINRVEYTPAGNDDIADEQQAIFVLADTVIIGRWTGAGAGTVAQGQMLVEEEDA